MQRTLRIVGAVVALVMTVAIAGCGSGGVGDGGTLVLRPPTDPSKIVIVSPLGETSRTFMIRQTNFAGIIEVVCGNRDGSPESIVGFTENAGARLYSVKFPRYPVNAGITIILKRITVTDDSSMSKVPGASSVVNIRPGEGEVVEVKIGRENNGRSSLVLVNPSRPEGGEPI